MTAPESKEMHAALSTPVNLIELAERCERAEGPYIGLDAEIELVRGNWTPEHYDAWCRFQECGEAVNPPMCRPVNPAPFTGSLDAAMTLVPEGFDWIICRANGGLTIHAEVGNREQVFGETPALALCAASLRAIAANHP